MRSLLRSSLIWTLAIALTIAGLPLAHARNCDTMQAAPASHAHHDMRTDVTDEMAVDRAAVLDHAPSRQHGDTPAPSPCRCLNCSSLCAAFVAPLPQIVKIERHVAAIVYTAGATPQQDAAIVIDPGIPIAA